VGIQLQVQLTEELVMRQLGQLRKLKVTLLFNDSERAKVIVMAFASMFLCLSFKCS
jgi:hypothetical protein